MAYMPKKQPRRGYQAERSPRKPTSDQGFYNSTQWRNTRRIHITKNPVCEVCEQPGNPVDHIVPVDQGGERLRNENLMTLCDSCHNRKSGMEGHKGVLIATMKNDRGCLIPVDRQEIIRILKA